MSQNLDYTNIVFDKTRYIISAVGADKGIYVGEVSSHTKLFDIDANSSIDELLKSANQEIINKKIEVKRENGIPTVWEYIVALHSLKQEEEITPVYEQILKAHYESKKFIATPTELAKDTELEKYEIINLHYGKFAKMVGEQIGFKPTQEINDKPVWTFVLCDDTHKQFKNKTQEWTWTLKKNVVNAIRFLGWFEGQDTDTTQSSHPQL